MLAITSSKMISASVSKKCGLTRGRSLMPVNACMKSANGSRREALFTAGLLVGAVNLVSNPAVAVSGVDLFDDRKAIEKGFDIIYEARDLDLPQGVRDGMTQMKENLADTKARVAESEKRFQSEISGYIKKQYWTEARNALRRQVGTLRFDLNTLSASKDTKEARQAAASASKDFIKQVEDLDFAISVKNLDKANDAYTKVIKSLDSVLAA
eukprot:TRINITY_DN918_c4_g1_i5.p1 TRINITY_DN918_c4_g1~~TRINITY_DN918_c4_g1_i5.p1  ORF type:complete len:211 (+),score=44.16 TRINITY_DN918_c4_g1_i5:526-1158(+)